MKIRFWPKLEFFPIRICYWSDGLFNMFKNSFVEEWTSEMEQSKTNSFVIWVIHYLCLVSLESWARVTTPPWIMFKIWWVIRTTAQKQKSSCQQPKYLGKLWAKNLSLKLLKRKNSHVTNDKKVFFKASCHEIFKSNKLLFSFLKSHLSSKKQSSYIYTGPYSLKKIFA